MPNIVRFQDRSYLKKLINRMTVDRLHYNQNDLLIFMDETGNPKLNQQHSVFGVGGCAVIASDYTRFLKPEWYVAKSEIFNLSFRQPFHAHHHLKYASDVQIKDLAMFIRNSPLKMFIQLINRRTMIEPLASGLDAVLEGICSSVQGLIFEPYQIDRWIFEHSDDLSRQAIVSMMEHGKNYFHMQRSEKNSAGLSFLRKQMAEPGLEISDLISYVSGLYWRNAPNFRPVYNDILVESFGDLSKGSSMTSLAVMSPIRIQTLSDGSTHVSSPPRIEITYLKQGPRAERRRGNRG